MSVKPIVFDVQRLMKSHSSIIIRLIIFFFVLGAVVGIGLMWWIDSTSPIDERDLQSQVFTVSSGEGVRSIASRLAQDGLIRSPISFYIVVKLLGIERKIEAGDFRLNRSMHAKDIAKELTHGILDIWITTLEGWRVEEIATKLTKELDIPAQEFLKWAQEGYMFPDTYLISKDATASAIAKNFQDTFDVRVTTAMREDTKKTGLTIEEVIVLASIVEREGKSEEDRPVIAGILLNRLKADWPLQADATLQYALGYQANEKSWWKKYLTDEDKKISSPFNTYEHVGLPPFPISNPGLSSIRAVIYPAKTDYWYYLHDPNGGVHYAKTLEEHNANVDKYL